MKIEFNGVTIQLLADDELLPQAEIDAAYAVIRVCPTRIPNVDNSPGCIAVKGISNTHAKYRRPQNVVHIHVQSMDSKSFVDRAGDIGKAIRGGLSAWRKERCEDNV